MSPLPLVLHLVDDTTPGGVMRSIDYLTTAPAMTALARHRVQVVARNGALPQCAADVVVSHLPVSWRNLPRLVSLRARHPGTRLVHVEHGYTEAFTALNVTRKWRFFTLLRTAYSLFDKVVAVSAGQGAWMLGRRLVPAAMLAVIPPMVDLGPFRRPSPTARPIRTVGAIGRLHRQKGFDVLIEAFRTLSGADLALLIVGTGPEEARLRALAADDPRIRFQGHLARPEDGFAAVDLVAIPSRWEAFGLVALEARAAGRGVICADLDGLRQSGEGGRFVRGHCPRAWRDALAEALASDPSPARPVLPGDPAASWAGVLGQVASLVA